jgi:hypothetical protein
VNTIVAEARQVYGGLVAHGEQVVVSARVNRTTAPAAVAEPAVKAVRKAVKAVKKAAPRSRAPKA